LRWDVEGAPLLKSTANGIGSSDAVPSTLQGLVHSGDLEERTRWNEPVLSLRQADGGRASQQLLCARIDLVFQPRQKSESPDWFIRAEVGGTSELKNIMFSADAVRQHFYPGSARDGRACLHKLLSTDESANLNGLRLAWRVKTVAARLSGAVDIKVKAERAFNLLANPEVRSAFHVIPNSYPICRRSRRRSMAHSWM
jgi:hypothetical protein